MSGRGRGSSRRPAEGRGAEASGGKSPPPSPAGAQAAPGGRGRGQRRREEGEKPGRGRREKAPERGEGKEAAPTAPQERRAPQRPPKEALDPRPARSLREVLRTLVLRKKAVTEASERVNKVRDLLVAAIKEDPHFASIQIVGSGSYYEHLKICQPDEFDIVLKLPELRFELEPCDASASAGAFYYVKLKRNSGSLVHFLDDKDKERLSASKMLEAIRKIIKKEVKKIEEETEEKVQVKRKQLGCPAVTLLIGEPPSVISVDIILALEGGHHNQCVSTKDGLNIEKWLGKKVKRDFRHKPLCLVPKNVKDGKSYIEDSWRLSFSHIEKDIIMNHGSEKTCCETGGKKCCRKACLKLLKYLLELLKTKHENRNQFEKFCSYHAKTALFQACVKWPHDSEWLETDLEDCFEKFLDFFLDCLRNAELRHFFIPEFNLFSTDRIETVKCKALTKAIESERNNRFPIFSFEP